MSHRDKDKHLDSSHSCFSEKLCGPTVLG